jgi:serine/threonine protein kinase
MPEWIGKVIGNVRIEKLLARGGMAEVYLGSHLNLERPVAIKLLHSYIEEEPLLLERFHREAKVVAGLRHPNIVQIYDFDTIDGHPFIVMEYLKGPTLATYLRHLHQRKKHIPPIQIARLLNELSLALDYAHKQGVVHRDIKPGNIMLHNKLEDVSVDKPLTDDVEAIITDFGLVRIMNAATQTASGTVSGTPAYMSPEQARGDQTDHRTDIYSLGIVLYEMLAGRVPFEADSTLTVLHMQIHTTPPPIPGVPEAIQQVIDRALFKNPDERYQTSRELATDFYRAIGYTIPGTVPQVDPSQINTLAMDSPVATPAEKTQLESATPAPEVARVSTPKVEPEPAAVSEPAPVSQPPSTSQPASVSEPAPRPKRNVGLIGVGLFAIVCLAALGVGAYWFVNSRPSQPAPTPTVGEQITAPPPSPAVSDVPAPVVPDGSRMVQIPAGTYEVGKDPEGVNQSAVQSITLSAFWIDQYQVTNAEFQQFMPEWVIPAGRDQHPVVGVTWDQANAYCASLGKRLPREAEWEAAGRGPGTNPPLYPWGTDGTAEGSIFDLPNSTYEVGTQDFNVSPFQVYDMLYNVYEWVGEPYGSLTPGNHILRGARFSTPYDLAFRLEVPPGNTTDVQYAGFRCAADQVQ